MKISVVLICVPFFLLSGCSSGGGVQAPDLKDISVSRVEDPLDKYKERDKEKERDSNKLKIPNALIVLKTKI